MYVGVLLTNLLSYYFSKCYLYDVYTVSETRKGTHTFDASTIIVISLTPKKINHTRRVSILKSGQR